MDRAPNLSTGCKKRQLEIEITSNNELKVAFYNKEDDFCKNQAIIVLDIPFGTSFIALSHWFADKLQYYYFDMKYHEEDTNCSHIC